MSFSCDPVTTAERLRRLGGYLESEVLCGEQFVCPHYTACRGRREVKFSEGQLHHVGRHYDIAENGVPLRVVVVGQEYGEDRSKVSLTARYQQIMAIGVRRRFNRNGGSESRNPHMKGTTSALRLVFGGKPGVDYESEFLHFEDGTSCHLFDAFGLVNYLLCAAHVKGSQSQGSPTRGMKGNCARHFRAVLEIMEPTIVVVQGKGTGEWVKGAFKGLTEVDEIVYRGRINGRECVVGFFAHPSARAKELNWGLSERTPYLLGTVVPAIRQMRALLHRGR